MDVGGNLIVNTLPASVDMAKQGCGLVYTFRDYCADELAGGRLRPVLEEFLPETPGLFIYFPKEYRAMTPLRLLIDHLGQTIGAR